MPHPRVRLDPTDARIPDGVLAALGDRFTAVRAELGLSLDYPAEALAEARPWRQSHQVCRTRDETDLPFFTIDPPGSMDLDQAMHLERDGEGHRIRYAIADVPTFVRIGGHLDRATRERGQTVYCPDLRVPLHPEVLSEAAASLLPDAVRPAFVWDLRLDGSGELASAEVHRSMVRSVERLDYAEVQAAVDSGTDDDRFLMLREIGERRIDAGTGARWGKPADARAAGARRRGRRLHPGVPAARAGGGVERPGVTADRHGRGRDDDRGGCRSAAHDAGTHRGCRAAVPPRGARPGCRVGRGTGLRRLHPRPRPHEPRHLALIHEATALFRGAGYTAFDGEVPAERQHAAVAAPYAHVTAPLRRLVDRFALVVCEAVCRGRGGAGCRPRGAPDCSPELMRESDRRARAAERACADATEAAVLHGREGETFTRRRPRPHREGHGRPARRAARAGAGHRGPRRPSARRSRCGSRAPTSGPVSLSFVQP